MIRTSPAPPVTIRIRHDGRARLADRRGGHGLGESRSFRKLIQTSASSGAANGDPIVNPFVDIFIPRNSPTVLNSALLNSQFWDGRVEQRAAEDDVLTLEDAVNDLDLRDPLLAQALFPITSQHEMAGVAFGDFPPMVIRLLLLERLRGNEEYAARFASVYLARRILRFGNWAKPSPRLKTSSYSLLPPGMIM